MCIIDRSFRDSKIKLNLNVSNLNYGVLVCVAKITVLTRCFRLNKMVNLRIRLGIILFSSFVSAATYLIRIAYFCYQIIKLNIK